MSPTKTRVVDRILHWISAIAIVILLTDMNTRIHYVDYRIKGQMEHKQDAIEVHIVVAIVLLISLIGRMIWSHLFLHQDYKVKYKSNRHKLLVRTVHSSLYLICFALMVSGVFMVANYEHPLDIFSLLTLSEDGVMRSLYLAANEWHLQLKSIILVFVFVHVAGAIHSRK